MALFLLGILLASRSFVNATSDNVKYCYDYGPPCGPCTGLSDQETCNLFCNKTNTIYVCNSYPLICTDGYPCSVLCQGGNDQCAKATIDAEYVTQLDLRCGESGGDAGNECWELQVNAQFVTGIVNITCWKCHYMNVIC